MFGSTFKEVTIMSNPNRYDYDSDEYYYDEEYYRAHGYTHPRRIDVSKVTDKQSRCHHKPDDDDEHERKHGFVALFLKFFTFRTFGAGHCKCEQER